MKPHPRIRRTIKWGGAATMALLAALWGESSIRYHIIRPTSDTRVMLLLGRINFDHGRMPPQNLLILPARSDWEYRRYYGNAIQLWDGSFVSALRCEWHPYYEGWGCSFPIAVPLFVATATWIAAWRLDTLARRRGRLNLCPKCNYDRTGLAAGAVCPECGAAVRSPMADPDLPFPFFVLIADEQSFTQGRNQRELNDFEQIDIEEMIHWAWDTKGRKYKLVWKRSIGAWPEFVAADGIADFRAAVEQYHQRLARSGVKPKAFLCDPETLLAALRTMEHPAP